MRAVLLLVYLLSALTLAQAPVDSTEAVTSGDTEQPSEDPAIDEPFVPKEDIEDDLSVSYPVDI